MDRLGKYEIRGEIGSGTTGKVYEGWDPQIRRRVAIKAIRLLDAADSEAREQLDRFKQEARSAGRLQHPNIVGAFDYAETPELAYIVMEFVDGRTLKSILEDGPRPDVAEVVRLMDGLLSGLDYSHRNQVIHRDIKPANVMVTAAGVVKIADFGIARIGGGTMTRVGTIMGTPAYMSPEQIQGMETDARTDVYSAGVVLFQLLSGKRPFDGTMATIMNAVVNGPTPRASAKCARVTPALDAVVARAMARSPDDRYATAAAFNQALRAAVGAEESAWPDDATNDDATIVGQASVVGGPARPPSSGQTRRRDELEPVAAPTSGRGAATPSLAPKLLIGAAVLLVVAGGVLWAVTGRAPKPRPDTLATGVPAQSPSAPLTPAPEPRSPPGLASGQPATELPSASLLPPMTTPTSPGLPDEPEGPRSETQVAAVKPATTVPPNSVRRAIASVVSAAGCSVVTGDDQPEATPVLRGVVGRGESETALRAAVRDAAPELAPDWQVAIADGPYCAVLDTVRPYARPFGGGPGLGVTLAGRRTSLVADELIMPRVTMPDFAGSLQLDYVASDGSVVHLHEALNGVPYAALSTSEFGKPRPPGFGGWAVDKPFGTDLIVGIASSRPLFRSPRPASENLENYLRDLRVALDQADREGARVAAAVLLVTTSAKP